MPILISTGGSGISASFLDTIASVDGAGNTTHILKTSGVSSGTGGNANQIQGNSASGATDTGNPVKVAGVYNSPTIPTIAAGQRGDAQLTVNQSIRAFITCNPSNGADGLSNANVMAQISADNSQTNRSNLGVLGYYFNGSTWDRARGDTTGAWTVNAPTGAAGQALTSTATTVVASSQVLKASAGNLYGYNIVTGGSAGYLMIFDATSAPADGTVTPKRCIAVAANTSVDRSFDKPIRFTTGITLVFSTTGPFTKTASSTAFLAGEVV